MRSQGGQERRPPPNDEKVGVRETLKSAIKSIHWKVVLKWQVQLLFLSRIGRIFISKRTFP